MGANIDVFHKNPAHQRHLLANLTGVHKAELNLGGRRFSLDVVPVFNDANERLAPPCNGPTAPRNTAPSRKSRNWCRRRPPATSASASRRPARKASSSGWRRT